MDLENSSKFRVGSYELQFVPVIPVRKLVEFSDDTFSEKEKELAGEKKSNSLFKVPRNKLLSFENLHLSLHGAKCVDRNQGRKRREFNCFFTLKPNVK